MNTYEVTYKTHSGAIRKVTVEAIDAIDAKHLAEFFDGEVIVEAKARKVRYLKCRFCGRRKNWSTSRTHFGDGCKGRVSGVHHYVDAPYLTPLETWRAK